MLQFIQKTLYWIGSIGHLYNYLVLKVCNKEEYNGFQLYVIKDVDAKDADEFYEITINALKTIEEIDYRKYKRIKKYLRSIAYVQIGSDCYMHMQRSYFLDTLPKDKDYFASTIIHEATHGYLISKGFLYIKDKREQHERICVKEQFNFLVKIIENNKDLSEEAKNNEVLRYKEYFAESLKKEWWNKKIQREKRINHLKSIFKKEFISKAHDVKGNLVSEHKIVNGKRNGFYKYYYESGVLKEEGSYVNEQREGLVKHYYSNGSLKSESNLVNDMYHGPFKKYYKSGVLHQEGQYNKGQSDGLMKFYRENAKLKTEANYKCGKQHGISKWYDEGADPFLVKMQKKNNNIHNKGDQNGGSKRIDETGET